MENSLSFTNTKPVQSFMEDQNIDHLQVIRNPNSKRLFLAGDGDPIGKASTKQLGDNPQVSWCKDEEAGEEFWMIHRSNPQNVEHSFTR